MTHIIRLELDRCCVTRHHLLRSYLPCVFSEYAPRMECSRTSVLLHTPYKTLAPSTPRTSISTSAICLHSIQRSVNLSIWGLGGWIYVLSFSSEIECFSLPPPTRLTCDTLCFTTPSAWNYRDCDYFPIAPELNGLNCI